MSRVESLRFVCRALSPFVSGAALRPALGSVRWEEVVALANNYFVVPALWNALERKGLVAELEPPLAGYLEAVYRLNAERNGAITRQLEEAVAALNAAGIEPLLLKGGAALATGLFAAPGVRFMVDLDLWVPERAMPAAQEALSQLGYRAAEQEDHGLDFGHAKHEAPLWKEGEWVRLELHRRFLADEAQNAAFTTAAESRRLRLPNGAAARVLASSFQVLHSLLHSEICHRGHARRYIDLRQLHNFVTLCHAHSAEIDGRLIEAFMGALGLSRVLRAYRHQAAQLFALPTQEAVAVAERVWLFAALLPFRTRTARWTATMVCLIQSASLSFERATIERRYPSRNAVQLQFNRMRNLGRLLRRYRSPGRARRWLESRARTWRGWSRL